MSLKVELVDIERTAADFAVAYLLTAGEGGRVHLLAVTPRFGEQVVTVGGVGRHTVANVQACGRATLLWSPASAADHSLIVDGDATVHHSDDVGGTGEQARENAEVVMISIVPTKAILHRPAVDSGGQRVGNDCVDIVAR